MPPSFDEMGRSIDALIAKCHSEPVDLESQGISSSNLEFPPKEEDQVEESSSEALSENQQIVLSFCWHLLKV